MNHPLPGTVWIQFASCPFGGVGPNQIVVEPSALVTRSLFRSLCLLGYG